MKSIVLGTLLLAGLPAAAVAKSDKKEAKQSNLLFIFADQYRRASLGGIPNFRFTNS